MKLTKLTSALLVSGIVLTIGTSVAVNTTSVAAATVVSETAYEKVMSFTKADLNNVTGSNLSTTSINTVYSAMKKQETWTKLGYTKTEAKRIADRISVSNYQTVGILKDIVANEGLQFKVVLVNQPNYKAVNVGTIGEVVTPEAPITNEEDTTPEAPITNEEDTTPEAPITNEEDTTPETPSNSTLSSVVKEIEIEIEYKKLGDIEVDYEVKSNGRIKAEVKNKQTGVKIKDAAAQKAVEDLFVGLDAKTMSHAAIQDHVLTKLNASKSGLKKFEFEVKFADKSKVDFKIKY
ncbi:YusW family protein [Candidatus Enterococcus lemimoniae]|uniref:PepSY domain-containing protein n=1 Tax=Candidatus Enterococcus lemimoniae TaxID=1834167 RepID=A0ABZ2T5C3_9ENTE|nr:YusW family protein [Enterococcus sp. 12C11_DIV0727]OTO68180.1 hypothetical protein A5866_000375 [Enterococcus sp. 12C11_DIV0727]